VGRMASIRSGVGENMEDRYLFKAKFDDSDRWVKGQLIEVNDNYLIIPNHASKILAGWFSTSNIIEVKKDTICQCTGLKDKNGRLIWENGIVDFLGHRGIVKFECGSFGIAYEKHIDWDEIQANIMPLTGCENTLYACENDNYISLWEIYWNFNDEDDSLNTVEVIGNIFDNPELLESED
jgi:uncharacterized phage protein (TIGR01671 family)